MALSNAWPREATVSRIAPRRRELDARTLSQRWWGLDWRDVLPFHFDGGRAEFATMDDVLPFMKEHYPSIFGVKDLESRWLENPMNEAKRRFCAEMDCFIFRVDGEVAGVFMAHPWDWTSYYVRSLALMPQYRGRGLLGQMLDRLEEPLRAAGVERVETEVSPVNAPMIRTIGERGFVVTGQSATERWGVLLRYTKFLSHEASDVFRRQYAAMKVSTRSATQTTGVGHEEVRPAHDVNRPALEV